MNIKINDRFILTTNRHNWIVRESYLGFNKDGSEPKMQTKDSYFSKPESALNAIIDRSLALCDKADDLLDAIENAKKEIIQAVKKAAITKEK